MATTYTFTADGNYLLNATPGEMSADGLVLSFVITGTNSGVLAVNTAPPGSAVSLTNIAYLDAALALQSAGTAITATGLAYVSAADASRGDLYLVLNWTSGSTVVNVAPSSLGNGGGSPGGTIPAADVTAGTFGANTGETGAYGIPDDLAVGGDLTAATIDSAGAISGTAIDGTSVTYTTLVASTTALATPSALAATASNQFASTVSGATLMGFGTTHDATLKNRAGTTALGVTANTVDVTAAGAVAAVGVISNTAASATLAQSATTATVKSGTGTGSGDSDFDVRGAATVNKDYSFSVATTRRWTWRVSGTESGSDTGSGLTLLARDDAGTSIDAVLTCVRAAGGAIYTPAGRPVAFGGAPGAAATVTRSRAATTGITDATATTVATITIPNAAHSVTIRFTTVGSLGAGGAIGANEASASNSYMVTVARTAGVNAVGAISSAFGAAAANVAGAATCTATLDLGAVAGAVGATNTIAVRVTITKSGGASDNHTALTTWEVVNANATGVTVA